MSQTFETQFGGRTLTIETGKLARLAGGAVTVRYGDTLVLGTANRSDPRPGLDFFPLTVEFEERMYAAGKIPGGFIKREARASEAATLAARLTDRPIRPLFPEGYKDDIQLVITVLSTDQENEPDVLGTIAASAALTISEIPFAGPVGAVRIGRIDGEFVVNPTFSQLADSELDLDRLRHARRDHDGRGRAPSSCPRPSWPRRSCSATAPCSPSSTSRRSSRRRSARPRARRSSRPAPARSSSSPTGVDAGDEFVIVDVETTGTDPKMADLVEIAAVKVKGGKITDRWSTFVNPGRPIIGNQMHGIKDADVKKAPKPAEAAKAGPQVHRRLEDRRPLGRLRPRLHRGGPRRRHPLRVGPLPRHPDDRPRGLSGSRELQAPDALELLRHRARPGASGTARRRGDRQPADLVRQRPAGPDQRPCARRSPTRSGPTGPAATARRSRKRPAARRASARACSASSTRRPPASSPSTRASGWTAAA